MPFPEASTVQPKGKIHQNSEKMHPDLSAHLHSKECNEIIERLKECHKENKILKYFGSCNEVDASLTRCLKKERENNRKGNKKVGEPKSAIAKNDSIPDTT